MEKNSEDIRKFIFGHELAHVLLHNKLEKDFDHVKSVASRLYIAVVFASIALAYNLGGYKGLAGGLTGLLGVQFYAEYQIIQHRYTNEYDADMMSVKTFGCYDGAIEYLSQRIVDRPKSGSHPSSYDRRERIRQEKDKMSSEYKS